MNKLIISAPFWQLSILANCTSTLGSYTREYRGGFWYRLWRVLRTVRYYHGLHAWKNKLGLPNPGWTWLGREVAHGRISLQDKIVSISARKTEDWIWLLDCIRSVRPLAVELNVSCPNTPGEKDCSDYTSVYYYAVNIGVEAIVKLPPVNYEKHVEIAWCQGITGFHCCNTLWTPGGGLSGKPLKALSLSAIRHVTKMNPKRIIGGGGVTSLDDALEYLQAGATNVAVGSVLFNPFLWRRIRTIAEKING